MKGTPLVNYKVTVQYISQRIGDGIDAERSRNLFTNENLYETYKEAKKEALKILNDSRASQRELYKLVIEPVLLQEDLLGQS